MKKSARILSTALVAMLLAASVSGCSSSSSDGDTAQDAEAVTLTFSYWGNKDEIALKQSLIKEFTSTHPDIKIKKTYTDGGIYPQKLQTWFSSNTAPDVISMANDIMYDYASQGVFEDLAPYIEQDNLGPSWNPAMIDIFDYDGKIYAAPYILKTYAIAYNKDLFDEAGIDYPTAEWTEDEFISLAEQLTSGEGVEKIFGVNLQGYPSSIGRNLYGTNPLYDTETKTIHAEGNEEFKHTITMFSDIMKNGWSPSDSESKNLSGGFETGKFAMSLCGAYDMMTWEKLIGDSFDWDIVQYPSSPEYGPWTNTVHVDAITMSSDSKYKDQAWEFIKWNCTDETAQKMSSDVGIPALVEYANSEDYLNYYSDSYQVKYNKKVFVDMQQRSVPWETAGVWAKVNDEFSKQYNSIVLGETTVDEAIATLQEKGTEILSAE